MRPIEPNPRPVLVIICVAASLILGIYLATQPIMPSRNNIEPPHPLSASSKLHEPPLDIESHEKLWAAQNRAVQAHAERHATGLFKQAEAASLNESFAEAERLYLHAADLAEKAQRAETAKAAYENAIKRVDVDLIKRHSQDLWRKVEAQLAKAGVSQPSYADIAACYIEATAIINDAYPKAAIREAKDRIASNRMTEALDLLSGVIRDSSSFHDARTEFDAIAATTPSWWIQQAEKTAASETGSHTHKAYAYSAIAAVHHLAADKASYHHHIDQAIKCAKAVTVPDDFIATFIKLGDYQRDLGDKQGARRSLELAATGVETAQAQSFWYSLLAGKALRLFADDLWDRFDAHLHPLRTWERPMLLCRAYAFGGFPEKAWPDATNYCFFAPIAFFAAEKGDEELYRKARMATLQDIPKWPQDADSAWAFTTIASADAMFGNFEEAEIRVRNITWNRPWRAVGLAELAKLHAEKGNIEQAKKLFSESESPHSTAPSHQNAAWHIATKSAPGADLFLWIEGIPSASSRAFAYAGVAAALKSNK